MSLQLSLLCVLLSAPGEADTVTVSPTEDRAGPFLARVLAAAPLPGEKPRSRIERDEQGEVIRLHLDRIELTAEDYSALAHLPNLKYLSLRGTVTKSDDLAPLAALPRLEYLVLTETAIDDNVLPHLLALPALRTMCLLNVAISPDMVRELKRQKPKLSLGYSPLRAAP